MFNRLIVSFNQIQLVNNNGASSKMIGTSHRRAKVTSAAGPSPRLSSSPFISFPRVCRPSLPSARPHTYISRIAHAGVSARGERNARPRERERELDKAALENAPGRLEGAARSLNRRGIENREIEKGRRGDTRGVIERIYRREGAEMEDAAAGIDSSKTRAIALCVYQLFSPAARHVRAAISKTSRR